jgi:hypothetical protein
MARDQDALLLSADTRGLEKQMQKASGLVDKAATGAERRLKAMNDNTTRGFRPLSVASDQLNGSLTSANPRKPLSVTIIADPKDEDGHGWAVHDEVGHKAKDGSHVPARPSFFPTYRARKKGIKRRMSVATRKAVKSLFPI